MRILHRPGWRGKEGENHLPADSRNGMTLCGLAVGRTWTIREGDPTCKHCVENQRESV